MLAAHLAALPQARRHAARAGRLDKVDPVHLPSSSCRTWPALLRFLVVVVYSAMREHGAPLDAPADPASDYPARPEWYFLSLFQMLKHSPGHARGRRHDLDPRRSGRYLALLPLWDKAPSPRSARRIGFAGSR